MPNAEWNTGEIRRVARHVPVTLNGTLIGNVDLDALAGMTAEGNRRPGLRRKKGHLGFLGHTSRVEFHNIRIKDLSGQNTEGVGRRTREEP